MAGSWSPPPFPGRGGRGYGGPFAGPPKPSRWYENLPYQGPSRSEAPSWAQGSLFNLWAAMQGYAGFQGGRPLGKKYPFNPAAAPPPAAPPAAPPAGAPLGRQTWTPEYGLQGPTPAQLQQAAQTARYQNMAAAGVTQTANGLWNVREQRYLTPGEAAAFG